MGFSSFYIGATGMKTHSTNMEVLGNNIANVNTVGYKAARAHFETLFHSEVASGNSQTGIAQKGHGVSLGAILTDYSQGPAETTNTVTDVAISGRGFFKVVDDNNIERYTRAGNFRFNSEGVLTDPHGNAVQGQSGDIALQVDSNGLVVMDAQTTTSVAYAGNIPSGDYTATPPLSSPMSAGANPFFSLLNAWDGTSTDDVGLPSSSYTWSDGITIYDDQGQPHTIHFYFDQVANDTVSGAGSSRLFEYVVGMEPSEEGRAALAGTSGAGILMSGTLRFTSSGNLVEQTAFSFDGSGDIHNLSNWTPSDMNISATFAGAGSSSFSLDFGLGTTASAGVATAAEVGTDASALGGTQGQGSAPTMTAYETAGSSNYMTQNGYPEGVLVNISIDREGFLIGDFTNSQNMILDRFLLTTFTNDFGLRREGNNYFSYTPEAGTATEGFATEDQFGTIASNSLEQSNVELAREFVHMISTQRGFQANSKIITTSDSLLQTAVNLKR